MSSRIQSPTAVHALPPITLPKNDEPHRTATVSVSKTSTMEDVSRRVLHRLGVSDADIATFNRRHGYDYVQHSAEALRRQGGLKNARNGRMSVVVSEATLSELHGIAAARTTTGRGEGQPPSAPTPAAGSVTASETHAAMQEGYNAAQQRRAKVEATPVAKPVSQMTAAEKLGEAMRRSLPQLPAEARDKVAQLLTPESLATMAVATGALIAVQGVPVLDVIVDAGLAIGGAVMLGKEALQVAGDVKEFVQGALRATTTGELEGAGKHFARAVSTIGVDTVAAILLHKAGTAVKENLPKPPATREMVTPEGVRIRVPVEEPPAQRSVSRMSSEGNGGGEKVAGPSGRTSTEKYLERHWEKATFGNVRKSIEYHVAKHGKGLSFVEYTQRAMKAFNDPKAVRTSTTDIQGRAAISVRSKQFGSGLFTPQGRLIWFHPAP